jgi:TatD DNase family protein
VNEPVRERKAEPGRGRDRSYPPPPEPLAVEVVDSHCHLDIRDGDEWMSVDAALSVAKAAGVGGIVQIGCDLPSARWSVELANARDNIVAGVALHPNEAPRLDSQGRSVLEEAWSEIDALAADARVRAVGETGLDYFRTGEDGRAVQDESFRRHIAMAKKHGKALVIHDRDAHDDVVKVLQSEGAPELVVFHCFSGGPELAQVCADNGWTMSFAGTVTFKNADPLREALRLAPLDLVLVETDAPYLTPMPYRGRPNASYLIPLTVRVMAQVKGVDEDEMASALAVNSERAFGPLT